MKKTLLTFALAVMTASSAMAGSVYIKYQSDGTAWLTVSAYNKNDSVAGSFIAQSSSTAQIHPTSSPNAHLTCPSAGACKIQIATTKWDDDNLGPLHTFMKATVIADGSYVFYGGSTLEKIHGSEVSVGPMALPAPGGGTTDCVAAVPGGKLLDNGNLNVLWQNDGNLVLYRNDGGGPVWGSGTDGKANQLCFQGDGNLVMYNGSTATPAVWATRTDGRGARLKLRQDCNLVVEDSSGNAVWSTGTRCY
jgi:hypothetical protein